VLLRTVADELQDTILSHFKVKLRITKFQLQALYQSSAEEEGVEGEKSYNLSFQNSTRLKSDRKEHRAKKKMSLQLALNIRK
jgi:hypothetical protein